MDTTGLLSMDTSDRCGDTIGTFFALFKQGVAQLAAIRELLEHEQQAQTAARRVRREIDASAPAAQTETQALQANAEEHAARIQRLKDAGLLPAESEGYDPQQAPNP